MAEVSKWTSYGISFIFRSAQNSPEALAKAVTFLSARGIERVETGLRRDGDTFLKVKMRGSVGLNPYKMDDLFEEWGLESWSMKY